MITVGRMRSTGKVSIVLIVALSILVPLAYTPTASAHRMVRFTSYDELRNFLQATPPSCNEGGNPGLIAPVPAGTATRGQLFFTSADHSQTNVQVQGVDELDTVKTDGQYIYTITNNTLFIVKAYPASEARTLSRISVDATLFGVFVNGDNLALLGETGSVSGGPLVASWRYQSSGNASIWVYDITSRATPSLTASIQVTGNYIGSRLIGNLVYLVTSRTTFIRDPAIELPVKIVNGQTQKIFSQQIYHSDIPDYSYSFTTVARVDLGSANPETGSETFLIGTSSTIYVSMNDIYLTSPRWACNEQQTVIHRINIEKGIRYEATGTVPGHILNQFSMDEYNGYFRVATTTYRSQVLRIGSTAPIPSSGVPSGRPIMLGGQSTNVYVLNRDLRAVGRVENLASGEQFHSARFMGGRAYLVTFKKTDPLFVIDLQHPTSPRVLGELKVTGYSDYLQPYDETHIIGIGKETEDAGSFAWYQGVKVSLFDVRDPGHPVEVSKFVIGDRGTNSPALTDHKAVLFDHERNLLVIPVEVAKYEPQPAYSCQWGTLVWQGAYVFKVGVEDGLVFRGGITHLQNGEFPSWNNSQRFVSRALYIGVVLYTISSSTIKMNNLGDLSEIGKMTL